MRDKKRIKRILNMIESIWENMPDQRFFQLLINIGMIEDNGILWRLEDDKTEKHLKKQMKIWKVKIKK